MTTKEKILTLIKDINYAYNDCTMYETIKYLLEEMEVVRCKDCIYWNELPSSTAAPECHRCSYFSIDTVADGFCYRSEMRKEKK